MVFFNYSTLQVSAKIVYYGPALAGKTTNLQWIFKHSKPDTRGEMVSLATETDRTLFFDLLPIEAGEVAGFKTRIQLYTVPGQVFYNSTRKLVLKGVDGVVFVADSQRTMFQANVDSLQNLEDNLAEAGISLDDIPLTFQFNKRDLPNISSIEELNKALNRRRRPCIEATATEGDGVFETLTMISKETLQVLEKRLKKRSRTTGAEAAAGGRRANTDPGAGIATAAAGPPETKEEPEAATGFEAGLILIAHPRHENIGARFRLPTHICLEIGRSPAADVSVPGVRSISRRHARLDHRGDVVQIEDLGSTNGTLVNGERIAGKKTLRHGDAVQVGTAHFKFLHDQDPEHAYHQTIHHLFVRDGLTGLFNRTKFSDELNREFFHARRHQRPLSLVLFDVDDFRKLNRLYGRLCADHVLQRLARRVSDILLPDQIFARVGDDMFAILSPEGDAGAAQDLAEQVRHLIAEKDFHHGDVAARIDCSAGVAAIEPETREPNDLYAAAVRELTEAKRRRLTLKALVGQNLGRYCVEDYLGHGSIGEVYRARDSRLKRDVAVKVLLTELAEEDGFAERFEREARRGASLDHPHILPIYDIDEQGGLPFLVMPLIRGGTLAEKMIGRRHPLQEVVVLLYQLAAGLDEAHDSGVLHRDVKPQNVLIGKGGRLLLADFGLAALRTPDQLDDSHGLAEATLYMAPEVSAGEQALPASDLYSLAIVGYELLAGKPPFDAGNRLATLYQHATAPVPALAPQHEGLPPEIDQAFAGALAKSPSERPPSCRDFVNALAGCASAPLSDDTVKIGVTGLTTPSGKPAGRRR